MSRAQPLYRTIFINTIGVAMVPIILIMLLAYLWLLPRFKQNVQEHNQGIAMIVQSQVEQFMLAPGLLLGNILLELKSEEYLDPDHIRRLMEQQMQRMDVLDSLYLVDGDNRIRVLGLPDRIRNLRPQHQGSLYPDADFVRRARRTLTAQWSAVGPSPVSGDPAISLALPFDEQLVIGTFRLSQLAGYLAQIDREFSTLTIIAGPRGELLVGGEGRPGSDAVNDSLKAAFNSAGKAVRFHRAGMEYIGTRLPISGLDWSVIVAQPRALAFAVVERSRYILAVAALFGLCVAVLLGGFLARRVTRPLEAVVALSERVADGDYAPPTIATPIREFRRLISRLKLMVEALQAREKGLRDSEQRVAEQTRFYQTLLDTIPVPVFYKDTQGRYLGCNRAFEQFNGIQREQLHGRNVYDLAPVAQARQIDRLEKALLLETGNSSYEVRLADQQARERDLVMSKATFVNRAGEVAGIIGAMHDITERKAAEAEALRLQHFLTNIFDSMSSLLVSFDAHHRITQLNRSTAEVLGGRREALVGASVECLVERYPLDPAWFEQALASGEEQLMRRLACPDNSTYVDISVYPLTDSRGVVVRIDNVTEQVRLEEMMLQSEKMLSVGGLAAGMAHEINNPLAGILQNMQVLNKRVDPELDKNIRTALQCGTDMGAIDAYMQARAVPEILASIKESGQRAAEIVDNMLSFSRKSTSDFVQEDVASVIDRALQLALNDYELKQQYRIDQWRIQRDYRQAAPISCAPSKLQQVFFNLIRNSVQAFARSSGAPTPILRLRVWQAQPQRVNIEIEDNGPGMSEKVRKRVFEPFYTTKAVGRGTGLGLSVAYFIITEHHHGTMRVASEPGRGCRFSIELPVGPVPVAQGG